MHLPMASGALINLLDVSKISKRVHLITSPHLHAFKAHKRKQVGWATLHDIGE